MNRFVSGVALLSFFFVTAFGGGSVSASTGTGNKYFWVSQKTCESNGGRWKDSSSNCITSAKSADAICQTESAKVPSVSELTADVIKCGGRPVTGDDAAGERWGNYKNERYRNCMRKKGFVPNSTLTWTSDRAGTDWVYFVMSYGRFGTDTGGWPKLFYCIRNP